jgi:hypothetical protein
MYRENVFDRLLFLIFPLVVIEFCLYLSICKWHFVKRREIRFHRVYDSVVFFTVVFFFVCSRLISVFISFSEGRQNSFGYRALRTPTFALDSSYFSYLLLPNSKGFQCHYDNYGQIWVHIYISPTFGLFAQPAENSGARKSSGIVKHSSRLDALLNEIIPASCSSRDLFIV